MAILMPFGPEPLFGLITQRSLVQIQPPLSIGEGPLAPLRRLSNVRVVIIERDLSGGEHERAPMPHEAALGADRGGLEEAVMDCFIYHIVLYDK
jgi:hypothetical protein